MIRDSFQVISTYDETEEKIYFLYVPNITDEKNKKLDKLIGISPYDNIVFYVLNTRANRVPELLTNFYINNIPIPDTDIENCAEALVCLINKKENISISYPLKSNETYIKLNNEKLKKKFSKEKIVNKTRDPNKNWNDIVKYKLLHQELYHTTNITTNNEITVYILHILMLNPSEDEDDLSSLIAKVKKDYPYNYSWIIVYDRSFNYKEIEIIGGHKKDFSDEVCEHTLAENSYLNGFILKPYKK